MQFQVHEARHVKVFVIHIVAFATLFSFFNASALIDFSRNVFALNKIVHKSC